MANSEDLTVIRYIWNIWYIWYHRQSDQ